MRTREQVKNYYERQIQYHLRNCQDENCNCFKTAILKKRIYESCIPDSFCDIQPSDIKHNIEMFNRVIQKYVKNLKKAKENSYGLILSGNNGVGKTYFISYILKEVIKQGWHAYYTTLPNLDYNLKRSMGDRGLQDRLHKMLQSDFLAIDELGKEYRTGKEESWIVNRFSEIINERNYGGRPTLLASNLTIEKISELYGKSLKSKLKEKFIVVQINGSDYRNVKYEDMKKDMGY